MRNIFMNFWMNVYMNMVGKGLSPLGKNTACKKGIKKYLEERINDLIALCFKNKAICMAVLSSDKSMFFSIYYCR